MKIPLSKQLYVRLSICAGWVPVVAVMMLGGTILQLVAQSSDFNSGTDAGWTRYSLPAYGAATFSYPPDDSGGKAYRISAPPTGEDALGLQNARAGSYRAGVTYSGRFSAGADMLAWNSTWHQETGLLFYLSDAGLGTSDGYSATYSSAYQNLYISAITDESEVTIGQLNGIILDQTHDYRLVVSSHDGITFLFQLFDKMDLDNPWVSAVCQDPFMAYSSGYCGLFVFQQNYPSMTEGAEATFDNYLAATPAAGAMPATVTDLSPPPGGKATAVYPTITVVVLDRDTSVDVSSIRLALDGVWIPSESLAIDPRVQKNDNPASGLREFSGATVTHAIKTLLPWGSPHTNTLVFADNTGVWRTNTWGWTADYPYLSASNSLPLGSLTVRGFDVRTAQSANNGDNLDNTLERARQQLAIPPLIPVDLTATSFVQLLSWDKTGTPTNVPGLCPGTYINIAVESLAYLELTAGIHRFQIDSDDRAGLYSGANLRDPNALALWENPGNTANSTFEFVVESDGLYPVRCLWEETGGGAHLYLRSVNLDDLSEVPINDPSNSKGVVKAWYPLVCLSASSAAGPFAADSGAVNALNLADITSGDCAPTPVGQMVTGGTFTVPVSGTARFYCLDGPRPTRITSFVKNGSTVVITYLFSE